MMNYTRALAFTGALAALVTATACKSDLNVPNLNNPSIAQVIVTGADVQTVIGNSFSTLYGAMYTNDNLAIPVTADEMTASFGNFGMRFNGQEPRIPYANLQGGSDAIVANTQWVRLYSALGSANDGLKSIAKGLVISNAATTDQYKSLAQFMQGWIYSELAITYDQAFTPDENSDPVALALVPYNTVATNALAKLDAAIAGFAGKTYTYPSTYVEDMPASAAQMAQLANSVAARMMVAVSRTGAANTAANWAKILTYANAGVTSDRLVSSTANNSFGSNWLFYTNTASWTRVDMRVIQAMDSTQPIIFTTQNGPPRATSADKRMGVVPAATAVASETADFRYNPSIPYSVARGIYFFSYWSYNRYHYFGEDSPNNGLGPMPVFLKAENDLIRAEALVRTNGDFNLAATLINNSRVTRGGLPPVTGAMTSAQLLSYINYERLVELYTTHLAVGWGDARRNDTMQAGTFRSLPVPAAELGTLNLPIYTFGGVGAPDGR